MKQPRIAFIGAGNMAASLIGGLRAQGLAASQLCASEPGAGQRAKVVGEHGIEVFADNAEAVRGADVIVLAVKPQVMKAVCLELAPSLTAFGNKIPTSYFRLVPHQEAPTNVCWGISNRSVLVRIPLGWTSGVDMSHVANPLEQEVMPEERGSAKQTFEIRSGDGSADVYQYLAALCVACRHGFEMPNAMEVAEKTYADGDINDAANAARLATLDQLPDSCAASADCLQRQRKVYEEQDIFDPGMLDAIIRQLQAFDDRTLRQDLSGDKQRTMQLVKRFFQCG